MCGLVLLGLVSTAIFGANSITWGPVTNRLQFGLSLDATKSALQVSIRNIGSSSKRVQVGIQGSKQPLYFVEMEATSLDGKKHKIVDLLILTEPPASLVIPEIVYIRPGETFKMRFLLKDLDHLPKLDRILKIRASFEARPRPSLWGDAFYKDLWTGKLSAELILSKN